MCKYYCPDSTGMYFLFAVEHTCTILVPTRARMCSVDLGHYWRGGPGIPSVSHVHTRNMGFHYDSLRAVKLVQPVNGLERLP
jgi:hypothetical protein